MIQCFNSELGGMEYNFWHNKDSNKLFDHMLFGIQVAISYFYSFSRTTSSYEWESLKFKRLTKIAIDQIVFEKSDLRVKDFIVYVMIMKKYKKQLLFVSNKKPNKTKLYLLMDRNCSFLLKRIRTWGNNEHYLILCCNNQFSKMFLLTSKMSTWFYIREWNDKLYTMRQR